MNAFILSRRTSDVPAAQLEAYRVLTRREWPFDSTQPRDLNAESAYRPVAYTLVLDGETVLGGCNWISREVLVNDLPVAVAGLAGVIVDAPHRNHGLAARMLGAATDWAREEGFACGVLFCGGTMPNYYARLGWRELRGQLSVSRFGRNEAVNIGDIVMARPLTSVAESQWPTWENATIHLGNGQW